jgi:arginine-tRNA-protein transferase
MEYEHVASISAQEYQRRLRAGWRRFGFSLFRNACPTCSACCSLRVLVDQFRPDRSQRRNRTMNQGVIRMEIGQPSVSTAKLRLYDRFHAFQADAKGWPDKPPEDPAGYMEAFVNNPFPTLEFRYYLRDWLVGVGYVDDLPQGLSAIYCFYDPNERHRGLGTWNVLNIIDLAATRMIPHVYLGYFVEACPSLAYKARFRPNEIRSPDGIWRSGAQNH